MHTLKRHATLLIAVACLAASAPIRAEPITLRGDDGELGEASVANEPGKNANTASLPATTGTAQETASAPAATALAERRSTAATAGEAAKAPADTAIPDPPDGRAPAPRTNLAFDTDAAAAGELADAAFSPFLQSEARAEENEWERDLKEAIRPIYDELAASGVVDTVHGIKSYLNLLNAAVAPDGGRSNGGSGPPTVTDPLVAERSAPWAGAAAGYGTDAPAVHGERERMVAALIFEEWISTLQPWFFALLACYLAWQAARLAINFSHWKSARAKKRGSRGTSGTSGNRHRRSTSRRRSAD